jgi:hypothetical protein
VSSSASKSCHRTNLGTNIRLTTHKAQDFPSIRLTTTSRNYGHWLRALARMFTCTPTSYRCFPLGFSPYRRYIFPTINLCSIKSTTRSNRPAGVAQSVERVALIIIMIFPTSRSRVRAPPSAIPTSIVDIPFLSFCLYLDLVEES